MKARINGVWAISAAGLVGAGALGQGGAGPGEAGPAQSVDPARAAQRQQDAGQPGPWGTPTALHRLSAAGDIPAITQLVREQNIPVDVQMHDGEDWLPGSTPLMWAAKYSDLQTMDLLMSLGANPRMRTANGTTALLWTIASNKEPVEMTRRLLEKGVDVHVRREDGTTPIVWAAAFARDPEVIDLLLDAGADIGTRHALQGMSPLMVAARQGNKGTFERLLARGADVNQQGEGGLTALMCVADSVEAPVEFVRALIEAGADVNAKRDDGTTALMMAAESLHPDRVVALIEAGADVGAQSADGRDALMYASLKGDANAALALLEAGASVTTRTKDNSTALLLASHGGEPTVVRMLIRRGADVNATRLDGMTPLLSARNISIVEPLVDAGADVNARLLREGWTAVMLAVSRGDLMTLRKLVNAGADLTLRDIDKFTAEEMAASVVEENPTARVMLDILRAGPVALGSPATEGAPGQTGNGARP